jgi:hypothetical protein
MLDQPRQTQRSLSRAGHLLNAVSFGIICSALAGAFVWLFVFGGVATITDTVDRAEFSSLPPWVTIGSPHQDVADSAVLTLSDMPPGWALSVDKDDDSDDLDAEIEPSAECKQYEGRDAFDGAQASASSEDMDGPDRQSLISDAYVFPGAEAAQTDLDEQRTVFSQCGSVLAEIFGAVMREGLAEEGIPPDQVQVQSVLEDLGSPNVGESGMMFRIRLSVTGPAGSFEFAIDFMAFRHGRMIGELGYFSFGTFHPDQEQQIAQIAAAKLQTANDSLLADG